MNPDSAALILAADIGGTKTNIGLYNAFDNGLELVREASYLNSNYADCEDMLARFIGDAGGVKVAVLGVAGYVLENRVTMTNLAWTVDAGKVASRFGMGRVEILNDLVATSWGVDRLDRNGLYVLQEGVKRPGNSALIAAGTGLGETILYWDGKSHIPIATESGHADFAPRNPLEVELHGHLMKLFGHVSWERAVSGQGLESIYQFLRLKKGQSMSERLRRRFATENAASVISDEAVRGTDNACLEALRLFVSIYGAEAGNLALRCAAISGVYVGGGIAPKILPALKEGGFIRSFADKGRFRDFLSEVPVYVILDEKTALIGAASYAARLLKDA